MEADLKVLTKKPTVVTYLIFIRNTPSFSMHLVKGPQFS